MTDFSSRALPDAAWDGDLAGVRLLLEAGADPRAAHGCALLHAAHRGHPPIVELLLAAGADPLARRSEALHRAAKGRTARHRACVRLLLPLSDTSRWEGWEWEEIPLRGCPDELVKLRPDCTARPARG
ncbi:ankyrin repeat domain-containing protein [Bacillus sp. NP157]|nr:ankyrin repeat domain-containing protein [Bacillus sp. NP157]